MWSGIVAEGCLLFWVFAPSSSHRGQKTGGAFFFFFFRALKNFPSARSPALHSILTFRAEQLQHRNERQNVVYHKVHRRQVEKSIRTRSCRWGRTETEKIQWKTCLNKNPLVQITLLLSVAGVINSQHGADFLISFNLPLIQDIILWLIINIDVTADATKNERQPVAHSKRARRSEVWISDMCLAQYVNVHLFRSKSA